MTFSAHPRAVLVFAGLDPGGGAGLAADILAIAAQGAHALPVATALTAQDNNRVFGAMPVAGHLIVEQARPLLDAFEIAAVKIGIPGNGDNAATIAEIVRSLRARRPDLPVVLDPVLFSGHGYALGQGDAIAAVRALLPLATIALPNLHEAAQLGQMDCENVMVTGGDADGDVVHNTWLRRGETVRSWRWPKLQSTYHGSGCTLAAAVVARLALGQELEQALDGAQAYTYRALVESFALAPGRRIPRRILQSI
jgi:hydroxymethylpyrimidine/phosphomethylpyrimidine kinase